ncbi:MAG TPA: tetratricopeptide repeat protein [Usitatibacter sp.]|nr:tetratricopeptide repeat protein [Usitatibacter sp.]
MTGAALADAFRLLQAGDAAGALRMAESIAAREPGNARASLAAGLALRALGRHAEARQAFEKARASDPRDAAPVFELGVLLEAHGSADDALAHYERSLTLRPGFAPAQAATLRLRGRQCAGRGDFAAAGDLFVRARALAPGDPDLPLYAAQALLLAGRWEEAWPHYARRDSRIAFEAREAAAGRTYRVPTAEALADRDVAIVAEQGLGDILFFARFAPALRGLARRITFTGAPRLASILARTGAFDEVRDAPAANDIPLLAADLPLALGSRLDLFAPSLRAAPDAARLSSWRDRLGTLGPRPWIAVTWRAGTPRALSSEALSKNVPVEDLFGALRSAGGTVLAFQRGLADGELARAASALGRPVHDLSQASEDVEDALAVVSLADRHVGVSSTNMHLAELAGRSADVLVPFPPEWRWRAEGESPWFPGFRVLRQDVDGSWARALAALAGEHPAGR